MYLIPANAKRGQYIFGIFRPIDLIIFGIGVFTTVILVMLLPMQQTWAAVLSISPAVFTGLLVMPAAHYHNVLQLLIEMYQYFSGRRRYVWKGWCIRDEQQWAMDRKLD